MLARGKKDFGSWAGEAALRLTSAALSTRRSVAEGQGVGEVANSDET